MSADPIALLEQLDSQEIAARLERIAAERQALLVLLRAARARDRRHQTEAEPATEEDS